LSLSLFYKMDSSLFHEDGIEEECFFYESE
jgi:hypothetical protein